MNKKMTTQELFEEYLKREWCDWMSFDDYKDARSEVIDIVDEESQP